MLDAFARLLETRLEGLLCALHRTEIAPASAQREHEHDGEQRVEVVGNRGNEGVEAIFTQIATNGNGPRRNRHDDADGGRGRIDDPCQLLAADLEAIGHGAHHATYR